MADVFNKNPSAFVNMNDLFPVLNDKIGLTSTQWQKAIENTYYLYNHLGLADVNVGSVETIFTTPGTLANVEVSHREIDVDGKTIDYFDYTFYIPSPKIETSLTTEIVSSPDEIGMTLEQQPIYGEGDKKDIIVGYKFLFNSKIAKQDTALQQVESLPAPTNALAGVFYQYIGETNNKYENGHIYKCVGYYPPIMNSTWTGYWADQSNELSIMPDLAIGFENRIVRYIGETNDKYTYGRFYEWYDTQITGGYSGDFRESKTYATSEDIETAISNAITTTLNTAI